MSVKDRIIEAWDNDEFLTITELALALDVGYSYARRVIRANFYVNGRPAKGQELQPGNPEVELRKAVAARDGVSVAAIRQRIKRHGREKAFSPEFKSSKRRAA